MNQAAPLSQTPRDTDCRKDGGFWLILVTYLAYGLVFIWRTSFIIEGQRIFALFDDAMISMRYAKNFAAGHGLTWNPGEYVEGITNPLWTVVMAGVHLLPVSPYHTSLVVQLISLACLAGNLVVVYKLARHLAGGERTAGWLAMAATAFYYPLNTWGLLGMEVGLLALMVTAAVYLLLRKPDSLWPWILIALAIWVRMDLAVVGIALMFGAAVIDWPDRKRIVRHVIFAVVTLTVALGALTLWRWTYYGDILPNTYYLKMTGYPAMRRIHHGWGVFETFSFDLGWLVLLAAMACPLYLRSRSLAVLVIVVVFQSLYSIYVGGDAWETAGGANRFISTAIPLLMICLGVPIAVLLRGHWPRRSLAHAVVVTLIAAALIGQTNNTRRDDDWSRWSLQDQTLNVSAAPTLVSMAHLVERITQPDAKVAVVWAGIMPYFMDRYCVDLLGKSDPVIARLPMHLSEARFSDTLFWPGHLKWNYYYSLGEIKPDVIAQLWDFAHPAQAIWRLEVPTDAQPFLDRRYARVWYQGIPLLLRVKSSDILWEPAKALATSDPQWIGGRPEP